MIVRRNALSQPLLQNVCFILFTLNLCINAYHNIHVKADWFDRDVLYWIFYLWLLNKYIYIYCSRKRWSWKFAGWIPVDRSERWVWQYYTIVFSKFIISNRLCILFYPHKFSTQNVLSGTNLRTNMGSFRCVYCCRSIHACSQFNPQTISNQNPNVWW